MTGGASPPSSSSTSKPSHSGIWTSRKTKSGLRWRIFSTASAPVPHSPMISISASRRRRMARLLRAKGSSSTIRARMRAVPLGIIQSPFSEGHGDGNLNTAVVAVLYGELVALAVKASQPLVEIRQTDARRAVFPVCGEGGSVVVHVDGDRAIEPSRGNFDGAAEGSLGDPMADRIFDGELQKQTRNQGCKQLIGDVELYLKPLGKSRLLNLEVFAQELNLLGRRHLRPARPRH